MPTNEEIYSTPHIPRAERQIRLGSLLFTMVEPRPGFEVAYNRWYERDHFYSGCMIGAYTLAGQRYVATRDCKALRLGSGSIDLAKGSYLALYWILDGHHAEWDAWAVKQVNDLHAAGRMFKERDHIDADRTGAGPPVCRSCRVHHRPGARQDRCRRGRIPCRARLPRRRGAERIAATA